MNDDGFIDHQIIALKKGSVIIDGRLLSREAIVDVPTYAARLEEAIVENGNQLGSNSVDIKSVIVDGKFFNYFLNYLKIL